MNFLIKTVTFDEYRVPFVSPMRIGKGVLEYREGMFIELTDGDGVTGYGEIAPLDGFSPETVVQARDQVVELTGKLKGMELGIEFNKPGCRFPVVVGLPDGLCPSVRFGVETAVFQLMEQRLGKRFSAIVSEKPKTRVKVNALVQGGVSGIEGRVGEILKAGFGTIKIKVGRGELEEDIEVVKRVLQCIPSGVKVRLDANRLWNIEKALAFGRNFFGSMIEYIEEPVDRFKDILRFYGETGIGVALDESLEGMDIDNPGSLVGVEAFVLKPVVLGGVERVGRFIDLALRRGIKCVVSSCFEVGYGFGMLVEMAASIDFDDSASGLDTLKYLASPPVSIENGIINLSKQKFFGGPGGGFSKKPPGRRRHCAVVTTQGYHQLDQLVSSGIAFLREKGIKRDMRVALVRENSLEYIVLLEALWRMRAVAVPLNFRFPGNYIEKVVKRLNIQHVITGFDRIDLSREEREEHEGGEGEIDLNNDAVIILTSGSTSAEKAVLLTYGNFYYNALGSNENIELTEGDRWLLSLPLFHVGGLGILFRCFPAGAAVVIPSEEETWVESIIKYNITHVSLVSTQLQRLIEYLEKNGPGDFSHLKALLLGGSAFPASLIKKALSFNLPVFTTYGLSEMASQVATTPPEAPMEKLFTSGKPLNYRELKIIDNEICVKGRTLFKGYVEGTSVSLPVDDDGWFHTGDLGNIDAEGYLHVTGRKDNMFISGGENIVPEEIENILNQFSEIRHSVVVPVKDDTYGFRPAAFLKLTDPSKIDKDYLFYHLQEQLPRFKIPDTFYLWPEEITQTSLKIKRPLFMDLLEKPEKLTLLFRK